METIMIMLSYYDINGINTLEDKRHEKKLIQELDYMHFAVKDVRNDHITS
jgi:hypothetical protein